MAVKLTKHRTQIYLTDDQYRKVKKLAHSSDSTMAGVIRDAVNWLLHSGRSASQRSLEHRQSTQDK